VEWFLGQLTNGAVQLNLYSYFQLIKVQCIKNKKYSQIIWMLSIHACGRLEKAEENIVFLEKEELANFLK